MEYLEDTGFVAEKTDGDALDSQVKLQADKVTEKYYNIGYREGFFEAKSTALQHSFDLGFYHGALLAIKEGLGLPVTDNEISKDSLTVEDLREEHQKLKDTILSMSVSKPSSL